MDDDERRTKLYDRIVTEAGRALWQAKDLMWPERPTPWQRRILLLGARELLEDARWEAVSEEQELAAMEMQREIRGELKRMQQSGEGWTHDG